MLEYTHDDFKAALAAQKAACIKLTAYLKEENQDETIRRKLIEEFEEINGRVSLIGFSAPFRMN